MGRDKLELATDVKQFDEIEDFTVAEKVMHEWDILGFSLTAHPLELVREKLRAIGVSTAAQIRRMRTGSLVTAAGIVIRPHRPPTRSGRTVIFMTLEDETGLIDATIFEDVYHQYGPVIFGHGLLMVTGRLERNHGLSIIANRVAPLNIRSFTRQR
ncbi:MAG: hypothetical protein H5T86_01595 [Armatimonadetes bacterium]|nr:hypothetical protein [Armatimonadota bacterium]